MGQSMGGAGEISGVHERGSRSIYLGKKSVISAAQASLKSVGGGKVRGACQSRDIGIAGRIDGHSVGVVVARSTQVGAVHKRRARRRHLCQIRRVAPSQPPLESLLPCDTLNID